MWQAYQHIYPIRMELVTQALLMSTCGAEPY